MSEMRNVVTLRVQYRPARDLYARVDPTGLVPGEFKINTDGVVTVSQGCSDAAAFLGVMRVTVLSYYELDALPRMTG